MIQYELFKQQINNMVNNVVDKQQVDKKYCK